MNFYTQDNPQFRLNEGKVYDEIRINEPEV